MTNVVVLPSVIMINVILLHVIMMKVVSPSVLKTIVVLLNDIVKSVVLSVVRINAAPLIVIMRNLLVPRKQHGILIKTI